MNYPEALTYLYALGNEVAAMKLGLDRVERLLQDLGKPHHAIPAVLVAGTNGKGSTCAMLDRILRQAGCRVGLYTSPHLLCIEERIRINGEMISPHEFARLILEVRTVIEKLMARGDLPERPTFFEHVTAAAFLHFHRQRADIMVLEVGMGGRLDATNVVNPTVSLITNISYDHQQYLGFTLTEIAGEKAGIIKPRGRALIADSQPPEAAQILARQVEAMEARAIWVPPLPMTGQDESGKIVVMVGSQPVSLPFRSAVQTQNAALAVAAARLLLPPGEATETRICQGLEQGNWPGRTQWIDGAPPLLIDGAHNPAGVQALADCLRYNIPARPITLVFSAVNDKPAVELLTPLIPYIHDVVVCPIAGNPRSQTEADLAAAALQLWDGSRVRATHSCSDALQEARRLTPPTGLILVAGSLYLVGEALGVLKTLSDSE